jgi:hypothetical protein
MRTLIIATLAAMLLSGGAHADGYRAATTLEQVKAKCELVADGMVQPDDPYYGDPKYAGFSTFGSAIGGAIRHARDYDNCMVLHGFAKDQSPSTGAESPSAEVPAPVQETPIMPVKPKAHAPRSAQVRSPSKAPVTSAYAYPANTPAVLPAKGSRPPQMGTFGPDCPPPTYMCGYRDQY